MEWSYRAICKPPAMPVVMTCNSLISKWNQTRTHRLVDDDVEISIPAKVDGIAKSEKRNTKSQRLRGDILK
jgi:hypothetical protein